MQWIPGGVFSMGSDSFYPEERPLVCAEVEGFWIDEGPVTNAEFERFVQATSYQTVAERRPAPDKDPMIDPRLLVAGSLVFQRPRQPVGLSDWRAWWIYKEGAYWRHPEGPGSSIEARMDHPVVHIAFEDAKAYAIWAQKELPTEKEWEFAARGGLEGAPYVWGDELAPQGRLMAHIWQGVFPWQNLAGYVGTAPVGSFEPNGYGLFDMAGNVWEWTSDLYRDRHQIKDTRSCCAPDQTTEEPDQERRVIKGGSFLCAPNYCQRYRPAARQGQWADTSTCHLGFRCIRRNAPPRAQE